MGTSELLRYLEKLEIGLSSFSYEELSTDEAGRLKKTFNSFKNDLEDKVFGTPPSNQLEVIYEEIGISGPKHVAPIDYDQTFKNLNLLLNDFSEQGLDKQQKQILEELKQLASAQESGTGVQKYVGKSLNSDETHLINLEPLWDECMQQMDLMEELARLYKQNIVEFVGRTKVNLQSRNIRGIDFSCQKITPSLKMLKCQTLIEITEQMANACKSDNDLRHLNFLYNEFLSEYPKVEQLLDRDISKFRGA